MYEALLTLGAGILGLCVGALVNMKIMRSRKSLEFTSKRSCAICTVPVSSKEALPIVGYMALKGRCRKCRAVIPWQYPAMELAIGVLFGLFAARILLPEATVFSLPDFIDPGEGLVLFFRDAVMAVVLALVFMFDYRAFVIPDRITIPGMLIAILFNVWLGMSFEMILLGGFLLGSFFALQFLLSQGRWVGGGDIRMGALMGFLLGPVLGVVGLFIAYISGALAGLYLLLTKRREMDSHVPFGTFLALATVVCMLFGNYLVEWYFGLFS